MKNIKDEIRAILVEAGAPLHQLKWLVDSCPSVELARTYKRPPDWSIGDGQGNVPQ